MDSSIAKEITLTLTVEEASWLEGVMQNPLHGHDPSTEPALDREMRKLYWEHTSTQLRR